MKTQTIIDGYSKKGLLLFAFILGGGLLAFAEETTCDTTTTQTAYYINTPEHLKMINADEIEINYDLYSSGLLAINRTDFSSDLYMANNQTINKTKESNDLNNVDNEDDLVLENWMLDVSGWIK